jgi:CubicO group peptidase (beta-lactamase class C family)
MPGGLTAEGTPPKFPDASGALVSTADDLYAFASMLAADGGGLLSAESVRLMTRDRMTAAERSESRIFVGDHSGWGLMMLVPSGEAGSSRGIPGGFGWDGGPGTTWRTDTSRGLAGILLTQRMTTSPEPVSLVTDFWAAAYAAIDAA